MILYSLAEFWQSNYKSYKSVKINFLISIVFNVLMWVVLYYQMQPFSYLTEQGIIPLHYNVYFGIDLFGAWYSVFYLPIAGLFVILFNNIIAYLIINKERVLSMFLIYMQTLVNLILFTASVFIVLLNI